MARQTDRRSICPYCPSLNRRIQQNTFRRATTYLSANSLFVNDAALNESVKNKGECEVVHFFAHSSSGHALYHDITNIAAFADILLIKGRILALTLGQGDIIGDNLPGALQLIQQPGPVNPV